MKINFFFDYIDLWGKKNGKRYDITATAINDDDDDGNKQPLITH